MPIREEWCISNNIKIDVKRDCAIIKDKGNRFERKFSESICKCEKCLRKRNVQLIKKGQ